MKLKQVIGLTLIFLFQNFYSQNSSLEKIKLSNWGYINLPNTMEIQSGVYKKILDEAKKIFSVNTERIVFQQKGLNDFKNTETYARVIIRTDTSSEILPDLNIKKVTPNDLAELNQNYKELVFEAANNPKYPAKIISWNKVGLYILNGQKCINYSYTRKMGNNPETFSEFFVFWKKNKQHSINIEYRVNETSKWKKELVNCVKSLKFI